MDNHPGRHEFISLPAGHSNEEHHEHAGDSLHHLKPPIVNSLLGDHPTGAESIHKPCNPVNQSHVNINLLGWNFSWLVLVLFSLFEVDVMKRHHLFGGWGWFRLVGFLDILLTVFCLFLSGFEIVIANAN